MTDDEAIEAAFNAQHEQAFGALVQQNSGQIEGVLTQEQFLAMFALSQEAMAAEWGTARRILDRCDTRSALMGAYRRERDRDSEIIRAEVQRTQTFSRGQLQNIPTTDAMWEVIEGCRIAGHFGKLDMIGNFYASEYGTSIDGTFSVDADANRENPKRTGCLVMLLMIGAPLARWMLS